jgi:large subunit ribosomal protein L24
MAAKIKTGDYVVVLTGRDKGKKGKVVKSFPKEGRVVVEGVRIVTRHNRPSQANPDGGITRFPAAIDVSNVAHLDPKDGKPCRVGFKVLKDGKKVRVSKRTGEVING